MHGSTEYQNNNNNSKAVAALSGPIKVTNLQRQGPQGFPWQQQQSVLSFKARP